MKSRRTKRFRELSRQLPREVQLDLYDAYRQFKRDAYYPGLHFKCVDQKQRLYSVRIGLHYRAIGQWVIEKGENVIVWGWIGVHDKYDKRI